MASDEIKAAERLRRHNSGEKDVYGLPMFNPLHFIPQQFMEDLFEIQKAYLAEHPADADQPYSGDQWVEGVGLQIGVTADKRGRWWAEAHQDGARIVLTELKTMGEWRNLLDALGITPEKTNGKA